MTESTRITYDDLKLFFEIVLPVFFDVSTLPPESRPLNILSKLELQSQAKAMKALRLAVKDLLVPLTVEPKERIDRLSRQLEQANAPSIAIVRAWASRQSGAVLARGHINSDEEFEHLKGLLDMPDLGEGERKRIQAMVDAYEFGS